MSQHKHQNKFQDNHPHQLYEGLEHGDLARLVHNKLHIDEFRSKMGEDADILVLSIKTVEKKAAEDLMNFIERGYEWVLDADISTGELDDGDYLVFVELERTPAAAEHIVELIEDIINLTKQKISDWHFQYQKNDKEYPLLKRFIRQVVPLTPDQYIEKYDADEMFDKEIEQMKESARISIKKKAQVNDYTNKLRELARIL
jgi:predicted transcriptional regulator